MENRLDSYWAAAPIEKIAAEIEGRWEDYQNWGTATGYFARVIAAFDAFYGFNDDGTIAIYRDKKNIAHLKINHYKSLVRRMHIIATETKLAYQPRAHNTDSKSEVEADLARGICEYYGDEKHMNRTLSRAVLGALIQLEHYVHAPWDEAEGAELSVDGQQAIKSGDQLFETFGPLEVAKAVTTDRSPWYIIRKKVNKFDWAALHPEFADSIIGSGCEASQYDLTRRTANASTSQLGADEDMTYLLQFYHARTPALPEGRAVQVIAGDVLADGPLGKYAAVPVYRLAAGDVLGTGYGDSPAIDLLPLQQALDAIFSATVTNNLNNSLQLLWSPDPNLSVRTMEDGQILVTSAAEPKALNLTGSAAENYKMIDLLMQHEQLLSGINDAARGNPGASVATAGGQALMVAQAIQYISDLQKNYAVVAGDVATGLLNNIKAFAPEEMTAYIVGASRKGEIRKYRAQDIMNVERVGVDLGNPLTQSLAGRNDMVQAWQQYGIITNPKQIVEFLRTGELDGATEDPFSDMLLIRDENEQLRKGTAPQVLITDNHAEHIREHKAIMSGQEARSNPAVLAAWISHVQEHIAVMRQVPPDLAAVLSGQPLPPLAPPPDSPPATPQPGVSGVPLPPMPEGTPPQTQGAYDQQLAALPPAGAPAA